MSETPADPVAEAPASINAKPDEPTEAAPPANAPAKRVKKTKKSKKESLRAKYDALVASPPAEDKPEPKVEANVGDEEDENVEDEDGEFVDEGSDSDEPNEDSESSENDEEVDEVDDGAGELSEPEIEYGSRRRRNPVDYTKVLAEIEAEERAQKRQKTK